MSTYYAQEKSPSAGVYETDLSWLSSRKACSRVLKRDLHDLRLKSPSPAVVNQTHLALMKWEARRHL